MEDKIECLAISTKLQEVYDHLYKTDVNRQVLKSVWKADHVIGMCMKYPHKSIVDIGCGEGSVLKRLSEKRFGSLMCGLEVSPGGLKAAESQIIDGLAELRLFDGYNIPYETDRFDLALLCHVVQHVEHPRRLLREAARVARGVFVEVPLSDTVCLSKDYRASGCGNVNAFSEKSIRRLLQTCDLEVLDQEVTPPREEAAYHKWGAVGLFRHLVRAVALHIAPPLAKSVFAYQCALFCRRKCNV